jgi:uncharacterized membrane protein
VPGPAGEIDGVTTSTATSTLVRSVLLGMVTGGRMFTGLAAVAITTPQQGGRKPLSLLTGTRATRAVSLLAAGELVGDKLPKTPPRTQPPALVGRLGAGATSAAALAQRAGEAPLLPAVLGAAGALAWSYAGVAARAAAAAKAGSDLPGAVVEDALCVAGAAALALPGRPR